MTSWYKYLFEWPKEEILNLFHLKVASEKMSHAPVMQFLIDAVEV